MIRAKSKYKILFAVSAEGKGLGFSSVDFVKLKEWAQDSEIIFEGVHVEGPRRVETEDNLDLEKLHWLKTEVRVIKAKSNSKKEKGAAFARYAKLFNFDLIVTTSRGRGGIEPILYPSFTEILMSVAPVPVVILGEKGVSPPASRSILFPTDFSESSKETFISLIQQIKGLRLNVVLLHSALVQTYNYDYGFITLTGSSPNPYWEEHTFELGMMVHDWTEAAKKEGIACKLVVDEASYEVSESIINAATEHKISMIALSSNHFSPVVRKLVQLQCFQLWILGPKARVNRAEISDFLMDRTHAVQNLSSLQEEALR